MRGAPSGLQENIYQDTKIYESKLMEMKNKMERIVREKEEDARDYLNLKKSVEEQAQNSITERKLLYLKTLDIEKELKVMEENNNDKEKEIELKYILKSSPTKGMQIIIPKFEMERLINLYENFIII